MNDLSHFVPLTETVTIRGKKIKLGGVDFADLGQIIFRFPEIAKMIEARSFDVTKIGISNKAIAALIAAAAGKAGDEKAEASIASLSLGERVQLFTAALRLTSPGGIGPFTELVAVLSGGGASEAAAAASPARKGAKVILKN